MSLSNEISPYLVLIKSEAISTKGHEISRFNFHDREVKVQPVSSPDGSKKSLSPFQMSTVQLTLLPPTATPAEWSAKFSRTELTMLAKTIGVLGYSNQNKEEIITKIRAKMTATPAPAAPGNVSIRCSACKAVIGTAEFAS